MYIYMYIQTAHAYTGRETTKNGVKCIPGTKAPLILRGGVFHGAHSLAPPVVAAVAQGHAAANLHVLLL